MHVRCPHCHHAIEIVGQCELTDVNCSSCGSSFNLLPGTESYAPTTRTIGHFQLLEQLGAGGFGTVWKAKDSQLDRFVAVKIPRRDQVDPGNVEMFLREARAAAQLKHPQIVAVHEVGRDDGTLYIVSDFIQGVTLADRLTQGPFTPREAAELCAQIADALHHAHEAGVIHRDLKPHNIMLDGEGRPHIMDFGLAKREAGEITMTVDGKVLGTAAYMSPEQARGEAHRVDRRTDVYSLGVILFECLTGELPFRGNRAMLLHQVINDEPPSPRKLNSRVSRDLETITMKCLEKDPYRRYNRALDVGADLQHFISNKPIAARPVNQLERASRWIGRNPDLSYMIFFVVLFAAITVSSATRDFGASLEDGASIVSGIWFLFIVWVVGSFLAIGIRRWALRQSHGRQPIVSWASAVLLGLFGVMCIFFLTAAIGGEYLRLLHYRQIVRDLENEETKFKVISSYIVHDSYLADEWRRHEYDRFRFGIVDEVLDDARALKAAGEYERAIERFTFARHLMHDRSDYYKYIDAEVAYCKYTLNKMKVTRKMTSP